MKLKTTFDYMRMYKMHPFTIFVDGIIDMAASPRSCGLKFSEPNASRPFNLTKVCQTTFGNSPLGEISPLKKHQSTTLLEPTFFCWLYIAK
jgi:hypothetical protein